MIDRLKSGYDAFERRWRQSAGGDLSAPGARRSALWHFHLMDHAFLRVFWSNMAQVAPGVWRSNQPDDRRLKRYRDMGIKTVLSLRGDKPSSHLALERATCARLGLTFEVASIGARRLVPADRVLHLLDLFETVERPFVMHCKSGADRAGLAAALYLMHIEGRPVEEAAKQLSMRFLHSRRGATGLLDHMLDAYAADTAKEPMPIRTWIETRYDKHALEDEYRALQAKGG
ncbi:protein tyrosine/serine phosphatase [Rhodovulum iodosum]|uniref:Protein tyrosine/serine phosphatase n=1 Tax=Rhodovulum iodosum TaxID=68291 RepID=A0ABV3XP64_9RHOB|nr:tyrosine-protein phosphatase [Rhodovulum robiginosum]RSK31595.1 protein tyrosine phosphatase [Rhodovulum robiginosum]